MDSPTLQDFVLNLIYDPAARSAFELDPETTLQHAGLGDVTAADVQQLVPLVVDYAPATGILPGTELDDLSTGVANLDVAGAVAQLQTITAQAALTPAQGAAGADVNASVAGVHTAAVAGEDLFSGSVLSGASLGVPGIGGLATGTDLSVDHDPALDLDAGVATQSPVDITVPDTGHLVPETDVLRPVQSLNPTETLDSVANVPSSLDLGHVTGLDVPGVEGATSSVVSVIKPDLADDVVHDVHGTVAGTVSGAVDATHGVTGALPGLGGQDDHDLGHDTLGGLTDLHF